MQAYNLYSKSTARVADGSYARLRSVKLAYNVPAAMLKRIGFSQMNIAVEGQNLALLYSDGELNGQDPEFFSSGGVALPQPRMVTISLNVGF